MNSSATLGVRLRELGLFDPAYYLRSYGAVMNPGESPFDHYLREGDAHGFRPSARFDPVIYRLRHPEASATNALLHFLDGLSDSERSTGGFGSAALRWIHGSRRSQRTQQADPYPYRRVSPLLKSLAPEIAGLPRRISDGVGTVGPTLQSELTEEHIASFTTPVGSLRIVTPKAAQFLDRIACNKPFGFARLPHGFWDSVAAVDEVTRPLLANRHVRLTEGMAKLLAIRFLKEQKPQNGAFEERVLDEFLENLNQRREQPDLFESISVFGYPTADDSSLVMTSAQPDIQERISAILQYYGKKDTVLDATSWKRWLITGALQRLPELCRAHPVMLVGPESLRGIGDAWSLKQFDVLAIPRGNSQKFRHDMLKNIARQLGSMTRQSGESTETPIVLFQCGGSFAFWLITQLIDKFPQCFFLDMGQALNAWCYDVEVNTQFTWNKLYLRTIIRNNGLEEYYRSRMGSRYDELLAQFPETTSL